MELNEYSGQNFLRNRWFTLVLKTHGAFLFTEIGAIVITDYTVFTEIKKYSLGVIDKKLKNNHLLKNNLSE